MACLMNYTVQCKDEVSGGVGCFIFDVKRWQQTGKFYAVGPVFSSMVEFYAWDNTNKPQRRESGFWERTEPAAPRQWLVRQGASRAKVMAGDYQAARERAAAIGFNDPDAIVLADGVAA